MCMETNAKPAGTSTILVKEHTSIYMGLVKAYRMVSDSSEIMKHCKLKYESGFEKECCV